MEDYFYVSQNEVTISYQEFRNLPINKRKILLELCDKRQEDLKKLLPKT